MANEIQRQERHKTLKEQLEIEKNAKNRAYSFIISNGLLYEFRDWCEATEKIDPFVLCTQLLEKLIKE